MCFCSRECSLASQWKSVFPMRINKLTAMLSIIINMNRHFPFSMLCWTSTHTRFKDLVQTLNIDNRWKSHSWKGTSWEITPAPRWSVKHENNSYLKLKWCVVHYGGNSYTAGQSHVRQPLGGTKSPLSKAYSDPLKVKSCWQAGAMSSDVTFAIWEGDSNRVSNKQWQSIPNAKSCFWKRKWGLEGLHGRRGKERRAEDQHCYVF